MTVVELESKRTIQTDAELMGLLFLHGTALGAWFVPLGSVLDQAGMHSIKPYAFAAFGHRRHHVPLFFGAMADRSVPPLKVLRWVSLAAAVAGSVVALAIEQRASSWLVLLLIQIQSLFSSPTASLIGSIVFSQLTGTHRFGAIRSLGTIGWMVGCWVVSLCGMDMSPHAFYLSGVLWIVLACFTLRLPQHNSTLTQGHQLTLRERFGWDAIVLLRNHDHRVVFLTAAMVAVPFAAFYPYSPSQLKDLGFDRVASWMSIGQVSEVMALLLIGRIQFRWKFHWIVSAGIGFGVLRYLLYSTNSSTFVVLGIACHGLAFTFTHISSQVYLAERIDAQWRTRAQALLSLMTGGIGNLSGYLACGAWFTFCKDGDSIDWRLYWGGLSLMVVLTLVYFLASYHGKSAASQRSSHTS